MTETEESEETFEIANNFFGFDVEDFASSICDLLETYIPKGIDGFGQKLFDVATLASDKRKIYEGIQKIHAKLEKSVETKSAVLEHYILTHVLKIPKDLVLPQAKRQAKKRKASEIDERTIDKQIQDLSNRILETKRATKEMKKELIAQKEDLNSYHTLVPHAAKGTLPSPFGEDDKTFLTKVESIAALARRLNEDTSKLRQVAASCSYPPVPSFNSLASSHRFNLSTDSMKPPTAESEVASAMDFAASLTS